MKCRNLMLNLQRVRYRGVTRGSLFSGAQPAAHKHYLLGKGVINPFPSNLKALNRKRLPNHSPPKPYAGHFTLVWMAEWDGQTDNRVTIHSLLSQSTLQPKENS